VWALLILVTVGGLGVLTALGNRFVKPTAFVRARQQLALGPPKLIDGAVVTLVGKVRPIDLLTAPISGRSCVALHVKAFIGPYWVTRFAMTQFILETDQGEVIVEHFHEAGLAFPVKTFHPAYDVAERFLVAIGRMPWEAGKAHFDEIIVEPGARIAVFGIIHTTLAVPDHSEVGFRESRQVIHLQGDPRHPLAMGEP
jgi:hypothetical protein